MPDATGVAVPPGIIPYFATGQSLSEPELMYAYETLLSWDGLKIILEGDDSFKISWQPRR